MDPVAVTSVFILGVLWIVIASLLWRQRTWRDWSHIVVPPPPELIRKWHEGEQAETLLDDLGIDRERDGKRLTLPERIRLVADCPNDA